MAFFHFGDAQNVRSSISCIYRKIICIQIIHTNFYLESKHTSDIPYNPLNRRP